MENNRKSNRLPEYDYSQEGYYFVTICTKNQEEVFGEIVDEKMVLNSLGQIAQKSWQEIPRHFTEVELDEFVIMPNHVHGVVVIDYGLPPAVGDRHACPLRREHRQNQKLPAMIGSFKSAVSKQIHDLGLSEFQWQRSYYDHIIRNKKSLFNIRQYIRNNPRKWALEQDRNHIKNLDISTFA